MGRLILNCDLGENENAEQTQRLLALVDAANIGCGVHAGSLEKTRVTIAAAQAAGVLIGAHPGLAAAGGRGTELPTADDFAQLLQQQVGSFMELASALGATVSHIKLHGSLYSAVEQDLELAAIYTEFLQSYPDLDVFTLAGGTFAKQCKKALPEVFADRGYRADGSLVPRSEPGALIEDVGAAVQRLQQWQASGYMPSVDGPAFQLEAGTVCVHSDSPNAAKLLKTIRTFQG